MDQNKIEFNHISTLIISMNLIENSPDGDQFFREDLLLSYLKSSSNLIKDLNEEFWEDMPIICNLKFRQKEYLGDSGAILLDGVISDIESDTNHHTEYFIGHKLWPDLRMGEIAFDDSFHLNSWDNYSLIIGSNLKAANLANLTNYILWSHSGELGWDIELADESNQFRIHGTSEEVFGSFR